MYIVLVEGAEVVVSEEHTQLLLVYGACEFTQAAVGQLGCRLVEKLLRYEGCNSNNIYYL